MALVRVIARTGQKVQGSEDKFYRTYELHTCSLFQWGSQRNGRSGGQFKISPSRHDAREQFQKKQNEGYTIVGGDAVFDVDQAKLEQQIAAGNKACGAFLDSLLAAAAPPSPLAPPVAKPDPAKPADTPAPQVGTDRIAATNQRALAAISLAAVDPAKAMTEFAMLNSDVEELEAALRKVKSYMGTLEILVDEAVS